ncbi:hypothetical protein A3D77_04085 [Candidatus Gottesmanbacteria bacterium RIFCSPHIGHO2_02_FULL_39_11]|uniref:Uncharacterized protein n=1 Tax=Candidatus Gottesmanbacteria bacterium RIFCSPHIGHO2_02_FULL_39_11 TaxID=1798382 RepID=A0A1F5ZJK6_9BACT|nr:MAG: hypothetical protein A3D77_04085 [Candidatus Gottesmanbacteria bacterium RIFCSPHIGHO2_02_FULL_39_11]
MKRKVIFTKGYIRFHDQVKALKEGKLRMVKKLAHEARHELEARSLIKQLNLRFTAYDYR